ncbi:thioredoxin-like protein [Guyanagaster necrorhizus]|uniref:Thioredoxin-like protein n=1 Tax=Guyanagaster necrorhizus TaxID=856835 RepID=A0A9P8AQD3_9AGAR|nr:thioredoxin-like protein [Guyanagaster necrorhizus MCA 3950]KAG7443989.1 thioredoxin-like protein [Guyanagaster necrorhizus MCA 3950]
MLTTPLLALTLALIPSLVTAAIFPEGTTVKMLDAKGFKKVMKANETSMIAFVAPWCGHCQKMAPEYSKAAKALHPLLPTYAVDCDAEKNKRLCAEQGVQGFPTVKLFRRGDQMPPISYNDGERKAGAFFYWASQRVPRFVKKLYHVEELKPWIEESATSPKPRALLVTKEKDMPLLWKVLANKYSGDIDFVIHRNRKGKGSRALGYKSAEKIPLVLIYPPGETRAIRYDGPNKLEPLSKYFDTIVDGTVDWSIPEEPTVEEDMSGEDASTFEAETEADEIVIDSPATPTASEPEPEPTEEGVEPEPEVVGESLTAEPGESAPEQTVVEIVTEEPEEEEAESPEIADDAETEQVVLDTPGEPRPVDEL